MLNRICCAILAFAALLPNSPGVRGDDWPQWLGPTRDGVLTESGLIQSIPKDGLKVKWRIPIAGGYAGPAVQGNRVFVADYVREGGEAFNKPGKRAELKGRERLLCLNMKTGEEIWTYEYDRPYSISYPAGPRCTPTADGDRVYMLGAEGDLLCLSTENGQLIWKRSFSNDYGAPVPIWGHSAHPLVDKHQLICMVGGEGQAVVSFDKLTGKELWKAVDSKEAGYCPPRVIEAGGTRQLIAWHPTAIVSLAPATGKQFWKHPLKPQYGMSIAQPQHSGDLLYASGIGSTSVMLRLATDRPAAEDVWYGEAKNSVYCANSTPLLVDGVIYGADCGKGSMMAASTKDGSRLWESFKPTSGGTRRASHGTAFITRVGSQFFLFSEKGDLVIANISDKAYEEVGRFHLLEPTGECFGREVLWSHPAYAGKHIFARNDKEIVCASLDASEY